MVRDGDITGLTSNPTIFEQAIAQGDDYDDALARSWPRAARRGASSTRWRSRTSAPPPTSSRPSTSAPSGADGYVSIEVAPKLAHDTAATVREAQRLWRAVNRPNLMVKIPATAEGVPAIEECIAAGININVTLIFSLARYARGDGSLHPRPRRSGSRPASAVDRIASVASFFVSRVDTAVDQLLEERIGAATGRAAPPPRAPARQGGHRQRQARLRRLPRELRRRALRASAARGRAAAAAALGEHVDQEPGLPGRLLRRGVDRAGHRRTRCRPRRSAAYQDHGHPEDRIGQAVDRARSVLTQLAQDGIDIEAVTERLEAEGVASFAGSCRHAARHGRPASRGDSPGSAHHGTPRARRARRRPGGSPSLAAERVGERLWAEDPTLWKRRGTRARASFAWLEVAGADRACGRRHHRVRRRRARGGLDPGRGLRHGRRRRCRGGAAPLYRRRAAGGSTSACWTRRRRRRAGRGDAGRSGADIVPPDLVDAVVVGTPRADLPPALGPGTRGARRRCRRPIRRHQQSRRPARVAGSRARIPAGLPDAGRDRRPMVGALSPIGLVPAALMGIDLGSCSSAPGGWPSHAAPSSPPRQNPGLWLGATLGALAHSGRDKLTLSCPTDSPPSGLDRAADRRRHRQGRYAASSRSSASRSAARPSTARIDCSSTCASAPGRTAPPARSKPPAIPS